MVIVDTHQHYWQYEPKKLPWISSDMRVLQRHWLPADAQRLYPDDCEIYSLAVQACSSAEETDFLLDLAEKTPQIIGVVGWIDLFSMQFGDLLSQRSLGKLRGFRHILQDEINLTAVVGQEQFNHSIKMLQERGFTYDVLIFAHQFPVMEDFCQTHDGHWLILDHLGKPAIRHWKTHPELLNSWQFWIQKLAKLPHLVVKLSGLLTEAMQISGGALSAEAKNHIHGCMSQALEAFGPQRIMFGSDWPVCQLAASYQEVLEWVNVWADKHLTLAEKADFWQGNARRIY
ncbi:MAG: amidohydrolase family protein, partial [Gammaproteobacteria bacterium]|nr:amidohydrolase family protein [Gammaproteobacteria bacterium]